MGSGEGFGSGGVAVRDVRGGCSSGGRRDEIRAVNISAPDFWSKIPDSELSIDNCQASSLHNDDASNGCYLGNTKSQSLALDLDGKHALQKPGKIVRNSSGGSKRSRMMHMEVSKNKTGLHDVNGISSELASSPASCNIPEKRQKNNSTCRRGDKRNGKVHKNRCDSFSLKNGLVGFNSAAGGTNFFGIYGLKPDVFDITKYVEELSLDELLHGTYNCPTIPKEDKGKKAANSNNNILQSVRKVCSLLQDKKVLQAQKCVEIDISCIRKVPTGLVTASSSASQTDDKGDDCTLDMPSSDKAQESGDEIKASTNADSQIYQPKDILERLALPPPKDLDSLLSDASRTTSSKNCTDPRSGKPVSNRTGLPPFSWSHSFSGHSKLGADAIKMSTNRTTCPGRWVKVQNSTVLQKGSVDLLEDFESLTFDQSLVPLVNHMSEHPEKEFAPSERLLSTSGACSTSKAPADEHSPTFAAAQTLLHMASTFSSKENPTIKLLKNPSQLAMKACKSKAIERPDKSFGAPKSTTKPYKPVKFGDYDGFPLKKPRLSTDVTNAAPLFRSPPQKLVRDSNAITSSYGTNLVKNSYMMKPPRGGDRLPSSSSSSRQKVRKSSQ